MPDYSIEQEWMQKGYQYICGIDEAGRGPLCGPVVAAACILPVGLEIEGLNDSKKLTAKKREQLYDIIREKALLNLRDEIPHGIGVEMLSIQKQGPNLTEIHANVYCERASHKSIIIGRQGAMLRTIGAESRRDIENLLGTRINLQLWVKIREDWRNRLDDLRTLGYED